MNELKIKQEVIAVYERYLDAFKKSDQEGINECLSVPFYRFENGEIRSFDGFYTNVSDLKKRDTELPLRWIIAWLPLMKQRLTSC